MASSQRVPLRYLPSVGSTQKLIDRPRVHTLASPGIDAAVAAARAGYLEAVGVEFRISVGEDIADVHWDRSGQCVVFQADGVQSTQARQLRRNAALQQIGVEQQGTCPIKKMQ